MKTTLLRQAGLLALAFLPIVPVHAILLTYDDEYAIGSITPGVPDSNTARFDLLNALIAQPAGTTKTDYVAVFNGEQSPYTLKRTNNPTNGPATGSGSEHIDGPDFDATGYSYLIAHYGNGGELDIPNGQGGYFFVWDVSTLSTITLPSAGLSDFTVFGNSVPDSGTTAMLLGAGLVLLNLAARKRIIA